MGLSSSGEKVSNASVNHVYIETFKTCSSIYNNYFNFTLLHYMNMAYTMNIISIQHIHLEP